MSKVRLNERQFTRANLSFMLQHSEESGQPEDSSFQYDSKQMQSDKQDSTYPGSSQPRATDIAWILEEQRRSTASTAKANNICSIFINNQSIRGMLHVPELVTVADGDCQRIAIGGPGKGGDGCLPWLSVNTSKRFQLSTIVQIKQENVAVASSRRDDRAVASEAETIQAN
jgi:hypothetical protein